MDLLELLSTFSGDFPALCGLLGKADPSATKILLDQVKLPAGLNPADLVDEAAKKLSGKTPAEIMALITSDDFSLNSLLGIPDESEIDVMDDEADLTTEKGEAQE